MMFDYIVYIVGFITLIVIINLSMAYWPIQTFAILIAYMVLEIYLQYRYVTRGSSKDGGVK